MAECKECGKSIKAWEALGGACEDCYSYLQNNGRLKQKESVIEREEQTVFINKTLAATAFTSIAWVVVGLSLICSAIAALVLAADGQGFMAIIVFVSGCFSAVLLGLLAEISANIARLVNKSN